jgi:hypothetical protein
MARPERGARIRGEDPDAGGGPVRTGARDTNGHSLPGGCWCNGGAWIRGALVLVQEG